MIGKKNGNVPVSRKNCNWKALLQFQIEPFLLILLSFAFTWNELSKHSRGRLQGVAGHRMIVYWTELSIRVWMTRFSGLFLTQITMLSHVSPKLVPRESTFQLLFYRLSLDDLMILKISCKDLNRIPHIKKDLQESCKNTNILQV